MPAGEQYEPTLLDPRPRQRDDMEIIALTRVVGQQQDRSQILRIWPRLAPGPFLLSRVAVIAGHRGPRHLRGADHYALASASAASTEMRRSVPMEKYLSLPLRMSL